MLKIARSPEAQCVWPVPPGGPAPSPLALSWWPARPALASQWCDRLSGGLCVIPRGLAQFIPISITQFCAKEHRARVDGRATARHLHGNIERLGAVLP